jgi:mono/diheme cytochrome c family protein
MRPSWRDRPLRIKAQCLALFRDELSTPGVEKWQGPGRGNRAVPADVWFDRRRGLMRIALMFLAVAAVACTSGLAAAQDKAKQGETIFKRTCGACHTVEPGKNRIGPSLAGVVGRKAGTAEEFKYSDQMMKSGIT